MKLYARSFVWRNYVGRIIYPECLKRVIFIILAFFFFFGYDTVL